MKDHRRENREFWVRFFAWAATGAFIFFGFVSCVMQVTKGQTL